MNINDILMHYRAAREAGEEQACSGGPMVRFPTEEDAIKIEVKVNHSNEVATGRIPRVETYPCPFCFFWHVGKEMIWAERERWTKASDYEKRKKMNLL